MARPWGMKTVPAIRGVQVRLGLVGRSPEVRRALGGLPSGESAAGARLRGPGGHGAVWALS